MRKIAKPGAILLAVILLSVLGAVFVNYVTKPVIDKNTADAKRKAIEEVLGSVKGEGRPVFFDPGNTSVTGITEFDTDSGKAYAVSVAPYGYVGPISMTVGVNDRLEVTGVNIVEMKETAGLGTKAKSKKFLDQFLGSQDIDTLSSASPTPAETISGATVTSKAVNKGIVEAVNKVGEIIE